MKFLISSRWIKEEISEVANLAFKGAAKEDYVLILVYKPLALGLILLPFSLAAQPLLSSAGLAEWCCRYFIRLLNLALACRVRCLPGHPVLYSVHLRSVFRDLSKNQAQLSHPGLSPLRCNSASLVGNL